VLFYLKKIRNTYSDPKFGQRGKVLVIPMSGKKKRFWNAVLACILLRKNFWNGVPARSITKIPQVMRISTYRTMNSD
jgi:hypothetical protein